MPKGIGYGNKDSMKRSKSSAKKAPLKKMMKKGKRTRRAAGK